MAIRYVNKETLFTAFNYTAPYLSVVFRARFFWDTHHPLHQFYVLLDLKRCVNMVKVLVPFYTWRGLFSHLVSSLVLRDIRHISGLWRITFSARRKVPRVMISENNILKLSCNWRIHVTEGEVSWKQGLFVTGLSPVILFLMNAARRTRTRISLVFGSLCPLWRENANYKKKLYPLGLQGFTQ